MNNVTVPIGPGKGQLKPTEEALKMLTLEMRGHVRDLVAMGENDSAAILDIYLTSLELILEQNTPSIITGFGLPDDLIKRAQKYHLAFPDQSGKRSKVFG